MKAPKSRLWLKSAAAAVVSCALVAAPLASTTATAAVVDAPIAYSASDATLALTPIGSFETGVFDESAAEIVQAHGDRLFVVNAQAGSVSVLDYSNPAAMTELFAIGSEGVANSVAIRPDGLGVVAFEASVKTDPGHLLFFDANASDAASAVLGTVAVGALPDMVTISGDGAYAVVANEGEPADDFSVDPEGSISVVALPGELAAPAQDAVRIADFHAFEGDALPEGVRVFGPTPHGDDLPVSRNLEPEYVAVDGGTAYVALQEANAVAEVDLASATVSAIRPLGFKDHGLAQNALDPSDKDGRAELRSYQGLKGVYMPDAIDAYTAGDGASYLVTANEGDAREWGDYAEPSRVKDLTDESGAPRDGYGPVCTDSALADKLGDDELGRLNVTKELGFDEARGCYSELYVFGGRSFSIWSTSGELVWDSGSSFEEVTLAANPEYFNSNHGESNLEGRSDDKGPEPESVVVGQVGDRSYAFVGFERVGGIATYDITNPGSPSFVTYVNNRDFSQSVEEGGDLAAAGDLGPEGLSFVDATDSPTGTPLLVAGNEVSGTTTVFSIEDLLAPVDVQVLTINDFHGRIEANAESGEAGAAVLAGAVQSYRAENPNTLFASAGDNIGASTFTSFIDDDSPTIESLAQAGLDVSVVGNHEFDRGFADLVERVIPGFGGDQFALGANVYRKGTKTPALREYVVQEVDGVRVAFIGTVTEQTAAMVSPTGIADIEFGDQLEAVNRVSAEIEAGDLADVTVLLTHEGSETSDCAAVEADATKFGELVRGADDAVDAIVSAHTHQKYDCVIDGRPVIQAHQYGTTVGKLDIRVDRASKQLVSIEGGLVPLVVDGAAAFEPDPEVEGIVNAAVENAEERGSVPVGRISADIVRGGEPSGSDRGVESSIGNLVADMYLWSTSNEGYAGAPASIGLMNPGGLRDDLRFGDDGTVTYRDVANVQPFANTIVTVLLTGAQLKAVLEEQWQPDGASRPKLHLGVSEGFSYEYDPDAARGERIVSMALHGEAIDPAATYTVATNSFLAGGGDNFLTFAEGTDRTDTGQADLAASIAYFEAHEVVDPAPLGRAVLSDGPGGGDPEGDVDNDGNADSGSGADGDGTDSEGDAAGSGADSDGAGGSGADGAEVDGAGVDGAGSDGRTAEHPGSDLASTGGDAPLLMSVAAGALLVLGAGVLVLRARRGA